MWVVLSPFLVWETSQTSLISAGLVSRQFISNGVGMKKGRPKVYIGYPRKTGFIYLQLPPGCWSSV